MVAQFIKLKVGRKLPLKKSETKVGDSTMDTVCKARKLNKIVIINNNEEEFNPENI
jgi:hypothetical protein